MTPEGFYTVMALFAGLIGLAVGSFTNVCIARIPDGRSVVWPPSHCPSCGHGIRPRDNVPVLGWILLRGRCRDCGLGISPLYPGIELLVGLISWLLFRRFVPDFGAIDAAHVTTWAFYLLFAFMLVAQTYIDIRHYIVPDEFSIYAVPVGVAGAALVSWLGGGEVPGWRESVVGALLGGGGLGGVAALYWLIRREEGLGLGDVKLLAMIGAFLGALPALPVVLIVASTTGAAVGLGLMLIKRKGLRLAVPFGPFLALGALVYVLHGEALSARFFPGLHLLLRNLR